MVDKDPIMGNMHTLAAVQLTRVLRLAAVGSIAVLALAGFFL